MFVRTVQDTGIHWVHQNTTPVGSIQKRHWNCRSDTLHECLVFRFKSHPPIVKARRGDYSIDIFTHAQHWQ